MPAGPAQVYTASVYIRGVNIESSEGWLEVQFLNASQAVLQQHQSAHVTSNQPFTKAEIAGMTAPVNTAWISVRAIVHMIAVPTANGDFLIFDDFELTGTPSADDRAYLSALAADTWAWIEQNVASGTGLPYDDDYRGEYTSATDIGLYLCDVVAARDLGLINTATATAKLGRAIGSVKQLQTWHGFQQCWNSVDTLLPSPHDTWISTIDSAHLAAGLLVAGQAFPQFQADCNGLVQAMDWTYFFDTAQQRVYGGFNTATGLLDPNWHLYFLGADSRMANFLAIALNKVPASSWAVLNRELETLYGVNYLQPGWDGGGLFMQYISGLWLNENPTVMGASADRFADAQVTKARFENYAVWGWSACASPTNGYLGWGGLLDRIVTPHASALALDDIPTRVVGNLRALQNGYGARDASYGFYDSIDVQSYEITDNFLVLDQSLLFLSLANYLGATNTRTWSAKSPVVQNGYWLIGDYGCSTGAVATQSGTINLTTQGTTDWAHWGRGGVVVFNHKAPGGAAVNKISNCSAVGGATISAATFSSGAYCTWSDGTPTVSSSSVRAGERVSGVGAGLTFTVPASTNLQTLKVYVGGYKSRGEFRATLSDGSAVDYVDASRSSTTTYYWPVYTIRFRSALPGQTLTVKWTMNTDSGSGRMILSAATLQ